MYFTRAGFILALVFISGSALQAQTKKYGEVRVDEFSSYDAKYDSTMPAIILFEYGYAYFDGDVNSYLDYHKRMVILNDDGLEYADVEIFINKEFDQEISNIKAASYQISESGSIIKTELEKRDVLNEKYDDEITGIKFSIPGVAKGSILEFSYKKRMGNPFMLADWKFHDYIPVQWSEYEMMIPVGLQYKMIFKGNDSLEVYEVKKALQSNVFNRNQGSYIIQMIKKDLPPVEELPFLINRDDYVSEVITQLQNISLPNYRFQNFFKDWDALSKELNNRGDFGKQRLNGEMKDTIDLLLLGKNTALEKAQAVYQYVAANYNWNGKHRILTEQGIRDTFEEKTGNTGDINHLLVEMLRYAGLNANPGLLSTRSNGSVLTNFALVNQFNMVVAVLEMEDGAFIMDASSGNRSFKSPNPKILYRNVFVIREDNSFGWLQSYPIDKNNERLSLNYEVTDSSAIKINYKGRLIGEFAEQVRTKIDPLELDEYWENELNDFEGLQVDSTIFSNLGSMGMQVNFETTLTLPRESILKENGEIIYLKPFLFLTLEENPFIKAERDFPIEINYPFKRQYVASVTIPEGFELDEMPEGSLFRLPNNTGYYKFQVNHHNNILNLVSDLSIASIFYSPEEYPLVKEMFQKIVDTQAYTVVFKKINSDSE